jgi:hypothetical protein
MPPAPFGGIVGRPEASHLSVSSPFHRLIFPGGTDQRRALYDHVAPQIANPNRLTFISKAQGADYTDLLDENILYRLILINRNRHAMALLPPRKDNACGQGGSQFLAGLCAESTTNADTVTFPGLSLRPSCCVRAVKSDGPDPSSHVSMKSYEPLNPV